MENSQIDLMAIVQHLWKNILAIALVAVLFGAAAFSYTVFMISPQYQATASLYVNNSSFSFGNSNFTISNAELAASSNLVNTYLYILKSRTTLEDIAKEADLSYSPDRLRGMISSKGITGTGAFEVTVTSSNPAEAELIANTVAKVLPERISEIVDGSAVRIVDYAIIPSRRSGPNMVDNTSKGILAGIAFSAALIVLKDLLDEKSKTQIKSVDELRSMYPDIMVLSMIPDMRSSERKNGYYSSYYYSDAAKKGGRKRG